MKQHKLPCILTIAGTDPSGGAGIQADIKTISATGGYAASIITALVAQNTQGVQSICAIPETFVQEQLDCVFNDLNIQAVKIGMLHDARIIQVVSQALEQLKPVNIVFDPVMVAKDGSTLLDFEAMALLKSRLMPLTDLITPNLHEAEKLLNKSLMSTTDMASAAADIGQEYQINVLLKGGHLQSDESSDVLFNLKKQCCIWFHSKRIKTNHTHGTGCSLSSAIASYLGQNLPLDDAVEKAKIYITKAIESGQQYSLGKGNGPVDHFYFLRGQK